MCIATPFEIIHVVSPKTMEIREMDSVKVDLSSYEQNYHYSSNINNPVVRIRKQKNGSWISDLRQIQMDIVIATPDFRHTSTIVKYHDYSF